MSSDICAICRDDISGFPTSTLQECGHMFHSECLITWFRSPREWSFSGPACTGLCPLCRLGPLKTVGHQTLKGRVSLLRRLARKKNIHPAVKETIIRLREAENTNKQSSKAYRDFRKENEKILSYRAILLRRRWRSRQKIWKIKQELSAFDPLAVQCHLDELYYN